MSVSAAESKIRDKLGNDQLGNAQTAITAALEAHSIAGVDSVNQSVLNGNLNDLGVAINAVMSILEYHRLTLDN